MAWLRAVRKQSVKYRPEDVVTPGDLIEKYGLGRRIDYTECWNCWRFKKFDRCMFRFWIRDKLFCVLPARDIDTRLLIGLKQHQDEQ